MDRYTKIAGRFLRYGLVAGVLMFAALPAHAASVSFFLDQSNKLPDGTNYLSVMLTENETGGVDFLVQTLDPLNNLAGSNFGIQTFGFSFTDGAWGEISGLPDHWSVQNNKQMSSFGKFDIHLAGKGNTRTDSLNFTVNGVTLNDFGSLFSAHVADFEWYTIDDNRRNWCDGRNCTTSAFFAGSMSVSQVPVPGALWLFGSGLAGLLGLASRRKRKTT